MSTQNTNFSAAESAAMKVNAPAFTLKTNATEFRPGPPKPMAPAMNTNTAAFQPSGGISMQASSFKPNFPPAQATQPFKPTPNYGSYPNYDSPPMPTPSHYAPPAYGGNQRNFAAPVPQ